MNGFVGLAPVTGVAQMAPICASWRRVAIVALFGSLLIGSAPTNLAQSSSLPADRLDQMIEAEMKQQKAPGLAVAIVRTGEVVLAKGYGLANVELNTSVNRQTVFQSGSVGKQFTAAAVMLLVEDKKLCLDDSIAEYFSNAPPTWRSITVRHLLTHTSGIPDYTSKELDYRRDYTEDELVTLAAGLAPEFAPGTRWNYSNTGYVLLGILIHKVSGRFYGDMLKERVFMPLGMCTARVISEEDIVTNRSAGYRIVNGELKNQEWVAPKLNTTADGSLYLTLDDLIAWDKGVRNRAVLTPDSWNQIFTPATLKSGKSYPYGFGWQVEEMGGLAWHHHGGSWQGFRSYVSRYVGADLTVIVLANCAGANPRKFVDMIASSLDPRLAVQSTPVEDREPAVASRVRAVLEASAKGELYPHDFIYMRAGFFPAGADAYRELLDGLGALQRLELVERRELGDDVAYRYVADYGEKKFGVRVTFAPGGRISLLSIVPE
jgi:CubicO group peptidase (beta-lactamase class C family)